MGNWPNHRIAIPAGFIVICIAPTACLCNKHPRLVQQPESCNTSLVLRCPFLALCPGKVGVWDVVEVASAPSIPSSSLERRQLSAEPFPYGFTGTGWGSQAPRYPWPCMHSLLQHHLLSLTPALPSQRIWIVFQFYKCHKCHVDCSYFGVEKSTS